MKAEVSLSIWLTGAALCSWLVSEKAASAEPSSVNGDQLWKDYQAMKEQYRRAYHTFDPMRPNYASDDPRNQRDTRALAEADARREKLRAAIAAQQSGITTQIRGR